MKRFLRIASVIGVLILICLLWAIDKVDYTPYFQSDYYQSTRQRLDSLSGQPSGAKDAVLVGFGKRTITPVLGAGQDDPVKGAFRALPMAGYGNRKGKPAEGVHDSIYVKSVALRVGGETLVFLASDLLIIPPEISDRVAQNLSSSVGIGREKIFFSATHTHSSLGGWSSGYVGKQFAGDPDTTVVSWIVQQLTTAAIEALHDLKPGCFGTGRFNAASFVNNRLVGDLGTKNPEFVFMVASQNNGKRAVLGVFGAHATTLGGWNMLISGDYPGYWQRKLERSGIDMAAFFAGSVGSHSPRSKGDQFEKPKYIGEALADSVLKYLPKVVCADTISLTSLTLKMDLPDFQVRISDGRILNPKITRRLFPDIGNVYIQAARIGPLIWITTPCDFSGELAKEYDNLLCTSGYTGVVTSFNGAYIGYIIPGKYYHMKEYESRLMSWFGPYTGPYFDEMIRRMIGTIVGP